MKQINFVKQIKSCLLLLTLSLTGFAQQSSFPGFRSGNFTGVNGVFFNPASIADSRYRWDINLLSLNIGVGNNNAAYKLSTFKDIDGDDLKNKLLSGSGRVDASGNIDIFGPSVMFNVTPKNSFALTSRLRTMVTVKNLDGPLARSIIDASDGLNLPYTINSTQPSVVNVNGWTEFGLSYGRVLVDNGSNFFKAGLTVKYLAGVGNTYVQVGNLNTSIEEDILLDDYLASGTTGSVAIGVGGLNITDIEADQIFEFNGTGIGADIGFEYEWRPSMNNFGRKDMNKYKLKLGVSLLDFGKIQYKRDQNKSGSYNINVAPGDRLYLAQFDGKELDEYKGILESPGNNPRYFTTVSGNNSNTYSVSLPTTLQINADLHLKRGFYVNLGGQVSFHTDKSNSVSDPSLYSGITLTPRYEGKAFGVYLPLNYNRLSEFNAGLSLRAGPLFVGSGSIITALIGKTKQADGHIGLRFGILHKAKKDKPVIPIETVTILSVDRDSDGIVDSLDKCPDLAGLATLQGCPDKDADGIADGDDRCPDIAGVAKYQGCPVPDTDKDGINDEEDKCVTVAGLARYQGCPIPDSDSDGINDEEDKCPKLAGTSANLGCPEIKKEIIDRVNVAAQNIFYATGSAKLLPKSFPSLNNVVQILKENPDFRVSIEGYTDITGTAVKNQALSEGRAKSVLDYLKSKGIEESRLTSAGFGPDKPIADNKTVAGRAKNRRVEIKLSNF